MTRTTATRRAAGILAAATALLLVEAYVLRAMERDRVSSNSRAPRAVLNRTYSDQSSSVSSSVMIAPYRNLPEAAGRLDFEEYRAEEGWSRRSTCSTASIDCTVYGRAGDSRMVLRWFETRHGATASSWKLHFYQMLDMVTRRPGDFAVVEIVTPVPEGKAEQASRSAMELAKTLSADSRQLLSAN